MDKNNLSWNESLHAGAFSLTKLSIESNQAFADDNRAEILTHLHWNTE